MEELESMAIVALKIRGFPIFLDKVTIKLAIGLPIDMTNIIPLGISPVLLELRAQSLGPGGMDPHHDAIHDKAGPQIEVLQSRQNFWIEIVQGLTS